MIATIKIYGANTDVATNPIVASITDVQALTGVVSAEFNVDWVEPKPINEGGTVDYLNSYQFAINAFRLGYNIVSEYVDFPSSTTALTTYQPFYNVIPKRFHWVDLGDYKLTTYTGQGSTNCLRVNILDYDQISEGGKKYWKITLGELKQNMGRTSGF